MGTWRVLRGSVARGGGSTIMYKMWSFSQSIGDVFTLASLEA